MSKNIKKNNTEIQIKEMNAQESLLLIFQKLNSKFNLSSTSIQVTL
jgi:hypothetical protein